MATWPEGKWADLKRSLVWGRKLTGNYWRRGPESCRSAADLERKAACYESLGKDLILSGPYLDENGDPIGSMIIMRDEDLTAAETFARADPFYLEHVFASLTIRRCDWFMNRPEGFVS